MKKKKLKRRETCKLRSKLAQPTELPHPTKVCPVFVGRSEQVVVLLETVLVDCESSSRARPIMNFYDTETFWRVDIRPAMCSREAEK